MKQHRYFIVNSEGTCVWLQPKDNASAGASKELQGTMKVTAEQLQNIEVRDTPMPAEDVLIQLLEKGWEPVRETSMGNGHVLLLFSRDE